MIVGKLDGKLAVITGGSRGITRWPVPRRSSNKGLTSSSRVDGQQAPDEAVKLIGRNVTGVQADSANLDDLDRLFDALFLIGPRLPLSQSSWSAISRAALSGDRAGSSGSG
jgi:hypothetical protein